MKEETQILIEDADSNNFINKVIEESKNRVVVVDFWAPWCNPCKQLTPLLESSIMSLQGKVKLIKIDIDQNQSLAQQLRIQSVPTVLAFYEGKPINGFAGVKTKDEIASFLSEILQLTENSSEELQQIKEILEKADKKVEEKNFEDAINDYTELLGASLQKNEMIQAIVGLGKCYLGLNKFNELDELLGQLENDIKESIEIKELVKSKDYLQKIEVNDISILKKQLEENKNNFEVRYNLARTHIANKEFSEAINNLLYIVEKKSDWNKGIAKKELLDIFSLLGNNNSLTVEGRSKLSNLIFK